MQGTGFHLGWIHGRTDLKERLESHGYTVAKQLGLGLSEGRLVQVAGVCVCVSLGAEGSVSVLCNGLSRSGWSSINTTR